MEGKTIPSDYSAIFTACDRDSQLPSSFSAAVAPEFLSIRGLLFYHSGALTFGLSTMSTSNRCPAPLALFCVCACVRVCVCVWLQTPSKARGWNREADRTYSGQNQAIPGESCFFFCVLWFCF